jgi:hypothetical protein
MTTKFSQIFLLATLAMAVASCNSKENSVINPAENYGTISAKVDGEAWSGAYCYGIAGGSSSKVMMIINGKASDKAVSGEDKITITLDSYTGAGEYKTTGKAFGWVKMTFKGAEYIYDLGTGTEPVIKITESTAPESILKPGKITGEFSGTITNKKAGKSIALTNGKFTCMRAL